MTLLVDMETFVATMSQLERVCSSRGDHKEAESLLFSVFAEGADTLNKKSEVECLK